MKNKEEKIIDTINRISKDIADGTVCMFSWHIEPAPDQVYRLNGKHVV